MASEVFFNPPSIPKKPSKWDYLPRRNMLTYIYKLVEHYRLLAINDTITLDGSINLTFIAVANEPKTYCKVLYSCHKLHSACIFTTSGLISTN